MDPGELLDHSEWLQDLARSLVLDPNQADDLAQEAGLAALTRPPARKTNPRGWLARVLRNVLYQQRRSEGRRRRREQAVARPEGSLADESEDRALIHRLLVEAVNELDEPFRTTVLLRYFENLLPAEIARRQNVPEATVRSRLRRGLERLRQRLDRHSDRAAWIVTLTRLAPAGAENLSAGTGIGLVPIALVGTLLAAGSFFLGHSFSGWRSGAGLARSVMLLEAGTWDCEWEYLDENENVVDRQSGTERYRWLIEGALQEIVTEIPAQGRRSRGYQFSRPETKESVLIDVDQEGRGWIFALDQESGSLLSLPQQRQDGTTEQLRITPLLEEPDERQLLMESSSDRGETWKKLFIQSMRRRGPPEVSDG